VIDLSEFALTSVRKQVEASRTAQGLPSIIEDTRVLDTVATILDHAKAAQGAA